MRWTRQAAAVWPQGTGSAATGGRNRFRDCQSGQPLLHIGVVPLVDDGREQRCQPGTMA